MSEHFEFVVASVSIVITLLTALLITQIGKR